MDKRRKFTPEFKVQVVLDLLSGAKSVAAVCREYELASQVVSAWREEFVHRAPEILAEANTKVRSSSASPTWNGWWVG